MVKFSTKVPSHYASRGIRHWSNTKIRCPLPYLIAEYTYRQPRFYAAKRASEAGDAEADLLVAHYDKPKSINMLAGTAVHEAAFAIVNGEMSQSEAVRHALSTLQEHKPAKFNKRDATITDHLLSDDGERVGKTIEQTVEGIREAFAGANNIDVEEKIELELPGIDVPIIGYTDGRGAGVIGEVKTRWDRVAKNSKTGFSNNSVPNAPQQNDIAQIALYQRAFGGGTCKLIYANRLSHIVHEVSQEQLDEAMNQTLVQLRKRQQILEFTAVEPIGSKAKLTEKDWLRSKQAAEAESVRNLIKICEVDWGDFRWRDYSPELLLEIKQVFSE
tara:strand:- start:31 stop:1020 length:990 start_codon:yes stop_codon:yes gene_type:complete